MINKNGYNIATLCVCIALAILQLFINYIQKNDVDDFFVKFFYGIIVYIIASQLAQGGIACSLVEEEEDTTQQTSFALAIITFFLVMLFLLQISPYNRKEIRGYPEWIAMMCYIVIQVVQFFISIVLISKHSS